MVHGSNIGTRRAGPLLPSETHSAVFTYPNSKELSRLQKEASLGRPIPFEEYGRYGSPGIQAIEAKLAFLMKAERAALFSSGMAAITTLFFTLLNRDDHVIHTHDIYRRTRQFIHETLGRYGIRATQVPVNEIRALEIAFIPGKTKCIFVETPSNPYLRVTSLSHLSEFAKAHGLITIIDNTFATPVNQQPHELGIDYVVQSATKYLNGHHDVIGGLVSGPEEGVGNVIRNRGILGGVLDPRAASLLSRGLKTLWLRVSHQNNSAMQIAEFLESHEAVSKVWYPGLKSHPDYAIAGREMNGFGGVVSFEIRGGKQETKIFLDRLKIPYIATSLGGLETLIEVPALFTEHSLTESQRQGLGFKDNFLRLAIGIEDPLDLIDDLRQSLEHLL